MDEFDIIRRYFTPEYSGEAVIIGVGDDGAVLRPAPGKDLVLVADSLVAGVHYPFHANAADVGYRSVAVNVSDIAAMGARPRWMTLALTLGEEDADWIEGFAQGIAAASRQFGIDLIGGDLTRGEQTVIAVQITGDVNPGDAMTRSGAQPGDGIFVSGTPGDAARGLEILQEQLTRADDPPNADRDALVRRFTHPDARVAFGQAIAPHASAAIDVSDGLFADLEKLLDASGVSGCLELNDLPMSPELLAVTDRDAALRCVLSGGDDYELCFTARESELLDAGVVADVPVSRVGQVGEGAGLSCRRDGQVFDYRDNGYRHFQ